MSNKLYEESDVQAIANAIRTKNGSSDTYMVSEMAQAVLDIPTGTTPTGTKQVTIDSAGTTTENVSAYANVEITVPQGQYKPNIDATPTNPSISVSNGGLITAEIMTQYVNDLLKPSFTEGYIKSSDVSMKVKIGGSATHQLTTVNGQTVTPTTSTQYIAVQGDYVLGAINVAPIPSQYIIPTGTKSITANGTGIDVTQYASVDVSVSGGGVTPDEIATGTGITNLILTGTSIRHRAFYRYNSIVSVVANNVVSLAESPGNPETWIFGECANLESIEMTSLTSVAGTKYFCASNPKLTRVWFPSLTGTGDYLLAFDTALVTVALPSAFAGYRSFYGCTKLQKVDYGGESTGGSGINVNNFFNCTKLNTLILRSSSVVNCNNINAFQGSPFASGGSGGTLYVPQALISSYQSATNWSTILGYANNSIVKIEGSPYENYYADGTPIT